MIPRQLGERVKVRKKRSSRGSPNLYSSIQQSDDEDNSSARVISGSDDIVVFNPENDCCEIQETVEMVYYKRNFLSQTLIFKNSILG